jgi:hypothetical protein
MIGSGICLLILALLVPEVATFWGIGVLSLVAGATLHVGGASGRLASGGHHPH